ncbi:hypothetical protein Nepgr_034007 [Nepenthes gracilis]|uniref:Uncharacterized protein n=1 Tax=Nepenthes gracilis TaxID=150966 RepID=A0AAD3TLN8_NEPGR|nr:hypothetical protein Nepgr_034007 [Nepenthes gracilis]
MSFLNFPDNSIGPGLRRGQTAQRRQADTENPVYCLPLRWRSIRGRWWNSFDGRWTSVMGAQAPVVGRRCSRNRDGGRGRSRGSVSGTLISLVTSKYAVGGASSALDWRLQ